MSTATCTVKVAWWSISFVCPYMIKNEQKPGIEKINKFPRKNRDHYRGHMGYCSEYYWWKENTRSYIAFVKINDVFPLSRVLCKW